MRGLINWPGGATTVRTNHPGPEVPPSDLLSSYDQHLVARQQQAFRTTYLEIGKLIVFMMLARNFKTNSAAIWAAKVTAQAIQLRTVKPKDS